MNKYRFSPFCIFTAYELGRRKSSSFAKKHWFRTHNRGYFSLFSHQGRLLGETPGFCLSHEGFVSPRRENGLTGFQITILCKQMEEKLFLIIIFPAGFHCSTSLKALTSPMFHFLPVFCFPRKLFVKLQAAFGAAVFFGKRDGKAIGVNK